MCQRQSFFLLKNTVSNIIARFPVDLAYQGREFNG